jgi:molybdopterin/thiamine biosynthesis adenylyltransferase
MTLGFSKQEVVRYSRNAILPEVGWHGQQRLKSSSVLLVGVGGIGGWRPDSRAAGEQGQIDSHRASRLERTLLFNHFV